MQKSDSPKHHDRILIIDDDDRVRFMVRLALDRSGYQNVEECSTARSGISKIERNLADLVLLDWMMPEISGLELLSYIRDWDKELPIIMLTSQDTEDRVITALKAGATDYIVKPFARKVLLSKINEALKKDC